MKKLLLCGLTSIMGLHASPCQSEDVLSFDRQEMVKPHNNYDDKVEGYWASCSNVDRDVYEGKYPFPKAHDEPWPTQEEFMCRLERIERHVETIYMKGYSYSRLTDEQLGTTEFYDEHAHIRWPVDFRSHYVARFNVKPSREFYAYVMHHPLGSE